MAMRDCSNPSCGVDAHVVGSEADAFCRNGPPTSAERQTQIRQLAGLSTNDMTVAALNSTDSYPTPEMGEPPAPAQWEGENFPMNYIPGMGESHIETYRLGAYGLELDEQERAAATSGDGTRIQQAAKDRERFNNLDVDHEAIKDAMATMGQALKSDATDHDTRIAQELYWASTEANFDDSRIDALLKSPYPEVRMMIAGQGERLQEISDSDPDDRVAEYAANRLTESAERRYEPSR